MFEVFKKELKELLRDKKTLMFIIALPLIIFPLIFGVLGYFMVQAQIDADLNSSIKCNHYAATRTSD
ncbi:MAG: ABC transporter permease, partial [Pseudoalteromonas sp.]